MTMKQTPFSSIDLQTSLWMSFVIFFSLGSAASARHPIANSVPTNKANNDSAQDRKKFSDKVKHLQAPDSTTIRIHPASRISSFMSEAYITRGPKSVLLSKPTNFRRNCG